MHGFIFAKSKFHKFGLPLEQNFPFTNLMEKLGKSGDISSMVRIFVIFCGRQKFMVPKHITMAQLRAWVAFRFRHGTYATSILFTSIP